MLRTVGLCAVVGGAVLAVASLSAPVATAGFVLLGEQLGLDQRDFRVKNTFVDPQANDNTVKQPEFPGTLGAALAIRKAHVEWSSGPWAGTGLGDGAASNPVLGSGGANFDNTWQGLTSDGGVNDNVHITIPSIGGGPLLSFIETPIADGWRITYIDNGFTWNDGPGTVPAGQWDLQAIATQMVGHSLGLNHSSVSGATMSTPISGTGEALRSIEADDIAGVQAIYGVKAVSKPLISALTGSRDLGGTLHVAGGNFSVTGNEVWFTAAAATGEPVKVGGVASTAGGTQLDVTLPVAIADGDVLVRRLGLGSGAVLSNAFPFDLAEGFTEIHPGFAPVGAPPVLTGLGDIAPGGGSFTVALSGGAPSASGLLFVAFTQGAAPFKGGTLYALPFAISLVLAVDGAGNLSLSAAMPASVPSGTVLVLQAGLSTGGGIQLSNGLRLDIP